MQLIKWLSILLSVSLGANFWFMYTWYQRENLPQSTQNTVANTALEVNSHAWQRYPKVDSQGLTNEDILPAKHSSLSYANDETLDISQQDYLKWLKSLANAQEFQKLEFEVRAYLRIYPQDTVAMLLEAQAYYHNKPLNIALVHYHELLTQSLSPKQQSDIEELIAVNTTRIIQQFSGDGAWNLLAQFLEPLVQIAPRNRQYLMALARAYGMQSQFTLMEDVLASFSSDDIRSIRLRSNVNARLNQTANNDSLASLPQGGIDSGLSNQRIADVLLQQERGQFVTHASVHNRSVRLLVDTGASTTAISDVAFSDIDSNEVEFLGLFNVNTAGGTIEAPIYKVKRITIGQRDILNTSVLILPAKNLGRYDGLLGMNVLGQFDLTYDATSETMRMYKKR
ncbi:MAG: clan AA aspartic protease (TIGR02281 family) [Patiriisocius sp.]|jgi:clan AA aspartic protease (TIGR02281 family)